MKIRAVGIPRLRVCFFGLFPVEQRPGLAAGLLDAETNLRYGLKYLARAYKLAGGDTCGTILRYQFGHRSQTMTSASRAYCAKVKVITAAAD